MRMHQMHACACNRPLLLLLLLLHACACSSTMPAAATASSSCMRLGDFDVVHAFLHAAAHASVAYVCMHALFHAIRMNLMHSMHAIACSSSSLLNRLCLLGIKETALSFFPLQLLLAAAAAARLLHIAAAAAAAAGGTSQRIFDFA